MTVRTCDILVIGGGMAGISAAALLAREARVIVLEMEPVPGHHSTGRSAAIFIRNYGSNVLRALNAASAGFFSEPVDVASESLLTERGELMIADEDEREALARYLDGSSGLERISPDEAVARVPILRRERIVEAVYEPDAQDIDVDRMFQGLQRLLKARGGEIVTGAGVTGIARRDGIWEAETPAGRFQAPTIINAAGAWADRVAALAGVAQVGLRPLRRSAALLPAPEGYDLRGWPLVVSASERWYLKPEAGKLMVSPADEDEVEPQDAWPDDMVVAEGLYRFEQAVTIPVTRVEHSWAGLRSFVADRNPVAGFAPGADGFLWLAGQGGYGIQAAPALARLATALCLGHEPDLPPDVVAALSPARASLATGKRVS
ncbi:NAD(P)/FAD-dependent oxidoreductase [Stappia sp.]|uniref:NAD(P)/FAD-dependent oxidoreductase n=1 Tax=Stappia sp. TaxID=1870903 RepID=UPI003A9A5073